MAHRHSRNRKTEGPNLIMFNVSVENMRPGEHREPELHDGTPGNVQLPCPSQQRSPLKQQGPEYEIKAQCNVFCGT